MTTLIASVSDPDLRTVFVLLAIVCFALAVWAAFENRIPAAVVLGFIGVLILLFGA